MDGFIRWCRRRPALCRAIAWSSATLLPVAAHAAPADAPGFAQAALVTHWSLPQPGHGAEAFRAPTLALPGMVPSGSLAQAPAPSEALTTSPTARAVPGAAGRALGAQDPQAPDTLRAERQQPYRMPRDIKRLQIAFQVLNAADAATTLVCLKRDDCHENNPLYGKHPKPIVVVGAKTLVGAVHYYAMRSLAVDYPGLARALGWVTVSIQGGVVGINVAKLF